MNGYQLAYFSRRKLTTNEGSTLEKTFWEMLFGSLDVLPLYQFLKRYIMMITNMKDYVTLDLDDYDANFRYIYRKTVIHFKEDLSNKIFRLQEQGKSDQTDTIQDRNYFWPTIIDMGGPIPATMIPCGAGIFHEIRELKKLLDLLRYK